MYVHVDSLFIVIKLKAKQAKIYICAASILLSILQNKALKEDAYSTESHCCTRVSVVILICSNIVPTSGDYKASVMLLLLL
jgi:hypothetical protein